MPAIQGIFLLIAAVLSASGFAQAHAANTTGTDSTLPRAAPLQRNVLTAQAMQQSPVAEQLITLSTPAEHFSALFLPANQAVAHGLVILLPGLGETFDWPTVIGPLRRKLPDAGWHTLSLNLPEPPPAQLSVRSSIASPVPEQILMQPPRPPAVEHEDSAPLEDTDTIEEDVETLDEPPTEAEPAEQEIVAEEEPAPIEPAAVQAIPIPDYPQRMHDFINAAVLYAETLNAREIILLGHHERAHWVLNYATEHSTLTPIRLALIAPRDSRLIHASYQHLIHISTLPIADFYYTGSSLSQQAAQQRINASRQAALQDYHQVALNSVSGARHIEQEQLFRRVKGWLNKPLNTQ